METTNHTQINLTVIPRFEGISPVRSSGLQFTAEHHERLDDSFQVFAANIVDSDMANVAGTLIWTIEQTAPGEVLINGNDPATNPAGEILTDIYDFNLIYIKSPVSLDLLHLNVEEANNRLPDWLEAGGVLLVTSPITQTNSNTIAGVQLSCAAADVAAYETATGKTFFIEFIYSARGSA